MLLKFLSCGPKYHSSNFVIIFFLLHQFIVTLFFNLVLSLVPMSKIITRAGSQGRTNGQGIPGKRRYRQHYQEL